VQHWLEKYGLAFLVAMALACSGYLAGSVAIPQPVPDYALRAQEIYRLEIGVAFFVAFYLATMAVVLALTGKGFAEVGPQGMKAEVVVAQRDQKELNHRILEEVRNANSDLEEMTRRFKSHEQRLEKLESESLS
jgi:hypothetical protein